YDFYTGGHQVNEDVFAYSNGSGAGRALVIYHNKFGSTSGWIHASTGFLNKASGNIESKTLHEGLNLSARPDQFVIFKDSATNLEYIRSSEEVRQRGLYFELGAYEYHVFLGFREIDDTAEGQYAQLNQYLSGRGVPSIDEALQELMLSPILNPLRALVNKGFLEARYQARLTSKQAKPDPTLLSLQEEKFANFIASIAEFTNTPSEVAPIVRENQRGLDSILKLPVFERHFPFPSSQKYLQSIDFINDGLADEPHIWHTLFLWNDLRLMGRVITSDRVFAEISRSWLEEWGVLRVVRTELAYLGLSNEQVYRAETVLKLLIQQQNWVYSAAQQTAYGLVKNWLANEEIRSFLNINRYRGKLWFNKEAFEELLWWMMTIALIRLSADPTKSLAELVESLFDAFELISAILAAEADSEYQVEKLLEGLK
ncbi:MAG: hypothetical protein ACNA70_09420, partial [Brevefilum sp.]